MSHIFKQWIPALIATVVCLVVLFTGLRATKPDSYHRMVEGAAIIAAFAFLLGIWSIGRFHLKKAVRFRDGSIHSWAFILAGVGTLAVTGAAFWVESLAQPSQLVFDYLISPAGASLAALLLFTLTLAAFRLLRIRRDWQAVVFILTTVVVLVTSTPVLGLNWRPFSEVRSWVINVFSTAGIRGLLLGVALGTIVTAIRALWPRPKS